MQFTRRDIVGSLATFSAQAIGLVPTAFAQERPKIVIAQPTDGFIYLPLYVARQKKFFAEEGADVEFVVFQKGVSEVLTAVIGGQADICVGNPGVQLRAQERGQKVQSFAGIQNQFGSDLVISDAAAQRTGLAKLTDPREKAAALKGLTIAVASPGSLTDLMVRHIARYGGLNPDRDLAITPIGGGGNMLAAFGQKRIDGYALSAPTSTAGIQRFGGKLVFDFAHGEYPPFADILFYSLIARKDWLLSRKDQAAAVVRAVWRGLHLIKSNPDQAYEAARTFFVDVPKSEFDLAWAQNLPSFRDSPRLDEAGMMKNYELLMEGEGRPVEVPIAETYTNIIVDSVGPSMK